MKIKRHPLLTKELLWTLTVVIAICILMFLVQGWIGTARIEARISSLGARWPIGLIVRKALSIIFAPLSGASSYLLAWSLFGRKLWLTYVVIGDTIWMTIAFWLARRKGHDVLKKFVGRKSLNQVDKLMHYLENKKVYIISRFLLFRIDDLLNFAAGLSKMNFRFFLPVSLIITAITSLIFVRLGYVSL